MEPPASNPVPAADPPSGSPTGAAPATARTTGTIGASVEATAEANKALVRRIYEEGLNRGDFAVLDALLDERLVDHSLFPGGGSGRESYKRRFALVRTAFPDARMTVEDGIADGDTVVYRRS